MKWKSKLISSSLPLEYQIAKTLVSKDFSVTSDYTYARSDTSLVKDFSVDLHAEYFPPYSRAKKIQCKLDILIECKQRNPKVTWLYFSDPNKIDFSLASYGAAIRSIDNFSKWFMNSNPYLSDVEANVCYKGIEIDEANDNVYDAEIKHGVMQLQYALPRLLNEQIPEVIQHENEFGPFFFTAILVTSATLMIARKNITTHSIEKTSKLSDLGKVVPYLMVYSDISPDFKTHCAQEFSPLLDHVDLKAVRDIEKYRLQNGEFDSHLPSLYINSLAKSGESQQTHFTHFLVCTDKYLSELVAEIKQEVNKTIKSLSSRSKFKSRKPKRYSLN